MQCITEKTVAEHIYVDDLVKISSPSKENFSLIVKAVQSASSRVRECGFKKLLLFKFNNDIKNLLIKGLGDTDELIRSDCIKILGQLDLPNNFDLIINALQDTSCFVVDSAIMCLTALETAQHIAIAVLQKMLKQENLCHESIIRIHYALYVLDPDYSVDHVLDFLIDSRDYRDRRAILNMLWDYCHEADVSYVLQRVQALINPNDFAIVLADLEKLKKELETMLTTKDAQTVEG